MFSFVEFPPSTPTPQLEQEFEITNLGQRLEHIAKVPNLLGVDANGNPKKLSTGEAILN